MDYKPFGKKWRAEMRETDKEQLIDMIETQCKKRAGIAPALPQDLTQKEPGEIDYLDDLIEKHELQDDRVPVQGIIATVFLVLVVLGVIAAIGLQPYFEMRAFNKFSDKKASYWDAVFSSLRIEASQNTPKKP